MKPAVWRTAALALIVAAIGFALYQPFLRQQDDSGITFIVPREHPGDIVVTRVEPNSPAARVGIRAGDRIAYGQTAMQRAQVAYALPGTRVTLLVNNSKRVVLTA